jgi:hypothetical protein
MRWYVVMLALVACEKEKPPPLDVHEGDYVLVTDADFGYPHEGRPNAAVLVTAPREVAQMRGWLIHNAHPLMHTCGYHWEVVLGGRDRVDGATNINQDCEVYEHDGEAILERVRAYGRRVESAPDHFIYTAVIPASVVQTDAITKLRARGELFFVDAGADLPFAWIEVTRIYHGDDDAADSFMRHELDQAVARLPARLDAHVVPSTAHPSLQTGDRIRWTIQVRLARGTNPDELAALLEPLGAQLGEHGTPDTYSVYLVSSERDAARAKTTLLARYPFVQEINEERGLGVEHLPAFEMERGPAAWQ